MFSGKPLPCHLLLTSFRLSCLYVSVKTWITDPSSGFCLVKKTSFHFSHFFYQSLYIPFFCLTWISFSDSSFSFFIHLLPLTLLRAASGEQQLLRRGRVTVRTIKTDHYGAIWRNKQMFTLTSHHSRLWLNHS